MKKVARFCVRVLLVVLAMILMTPVLLIFVECENTVLPNVLGLAYVTLPVLIYKIEDADGILHKFVRLYRIAFRELFSDL
jgi:hypothetical protein